MFFTKAILPIFCLAVVSGAVWSQQSPVRSNELSVSINHPIVSNGSSSHAALPGFGVAATIVDNRWAVMDRTLSFEFNYVRQKAAFSEFMGKAGSDYFEVHEAAICSFSIPATLRFGLLKEKRLFLEPGIFFDLTLYGSVSGIVHRQGGESVERTQRVRITPFNGGPSVAVGGEFPFEKGALIARSEARFGIANVYPDMGNSNYSRILNMYARVSVGWRF